MKTLIYRKGDNLKQFFSQIDDAFILGHHIFLDIQPGDGLGYEIVMVPSTKLNCVIVAGDYFNFKVTKDMPQEEYEKAVGTSMASIIHDTAMIYYYNDPDLWYDWENAAPIV